MYKQSAVILLHEQKTDSLILTKRTNNLRSHPGEFCFPGGAKDDNDFNLWSTALRELDEELGIQSNRVALIKALSPEYTFSGKEIFPWLASIETIEPYAMNKDEVCGVVTLPMKAVIRLDNYEYFSIERYGRTITSCKFIATPQLVWGATARIMKQLCLIK